MIEVELIRISPDSQYLEIIANCSNGYKFNRLEIRKYNPEGEPENPWQDLVSLITDGDTELVKRINVDLIGGAGTMYYLLLGQVEIAPADPENPLEETVTVACGDVNLIYFALHDKIQDLSREKIPLVEFELLNRGYFNLWGFEKAVELERYTDAERYFTTLQNFITECGYEKRVLEARLFEN